MFSLLSQHITLIPIGLLGLIAVYFLLKYPEVSFALFIAAYVIKGGINVGYFNLTAILLVISIIGFSLPILIGRKFEFRIKTADIWLCLFMGILIGGILWTPDSSIGIKKAWRVFVLTFIPYFLARIFLKQTSQVKRFLSTLLISASLVGIILVIQSYLTNFQGGRLQFFEANPIPEASLLGMGFLIATIGLIEHSFQRQWMRWLSIGIIPILLYGILLTGSRGPLVSVTIAMVFYLIVTFRKRPKFVFGVGLFVAILVIIVVKFNILPTGIVNRYDPLTWQTSMSVMERTFSYQSTWKTILQNPLIGAGTGTIYLAENIFLEIISNVGIIGLVLFIMFLYSVARKGCQYLRRTYPRQDEMTGGIGLIVLAITIALFIDKQVSYELAGDKDLFVFLGIMMNLPLMIKHSRMLGQRRRGNSNGTDQSRIIY